MEELQDENFAEEAKRYIEYLCLRRMQVHVPDISWNSPAEHIEAFRSRYEVEDFTDEHYDILARSTIKID